MPATTVTGAATSRTTEISARPSQADLASIPDETLVSRYGLTRAEIEAIKRAIAPAGTSDFDLILYAGLCHTLGLNPLVPGLVHFTRFGEEGGPQRTAIIVGIYGWITLARAQKDFDGYEVRVYPEDPNATPTHAVGRLWIKGVAHPIETTRTFKEAARLRRGRGEWDREPRLMMENAVIRRLFRLAWPTLFVPVRDESETDPIHLPGDLGKTVVGDHYGPPSEESPKTEAPASKMPAVDAEFHVPAPAPAPTSTPAPDPEPPAPTPADEEADPAVPALIQQISDTITGDHDQPWARSQYGLFADRMAALSQRERRMIELQQVRDVPFLESLLRDLQACRPRARA